MAERARRLDGRRVGGKLGEMRRLALCLLLTGCFGEPPDDKTVSTTIVLPMTTDAESSSSEAESSSSEGVEESSSSTGPDPFACPEWCPNSCDTLVPFERCRCTNDAICSLGDMTCHIPEGEGVGHCY